MEDAINGGIGGGLLAARLGGLALLQELKQFGE